MKIGDKQKLQVIKARAGQGRITYELDKKYVEKLAAYVKYEEPQTSYQNTPSQNTSNSCSKCGASILDNNKFCTECGSLQKAQPSAGTGEGGFCGSCGTALASKFAPCPKCGVKTTVKSPPPPQQQPQQQPPQYQPQHPQQNYGYGGKPSAAYWLLPIFLQFVGGIIAWVCIKDRDPRMAKNNLILGIILTVVPPGVYFLIVGLGFFNFLWR